MDAFSNDFIWYVWIPVGILIFILNYLGILYAKSRGKQFLFWDNDYEYETCIIWGAFAAFSWPVTLPLAIFIGVAGTIVACTLYYSKKIGYKLFNIKEEL